VLLLLPSLLHLANGIPTGATRYSAGGRAGFGEVFLVRLLLPLGRGSWGAAGGLLGGRASKSRALCRTAEPCLRPAPPLAVNAFQLAPDKDSCCKERRLATHVLHNLPCAGSVGGPGTTTSTHYPTALTHPAGKKHQKERRKQGMAVGCTITAR
jgi:hypothetical protein